MKRLCRKIILIKKNKIQVSVHVQCNEDEIDFESFQQYSYRHQLDDIIEDDEETAICQGISMIENIYQNSNGHLNIQQPLSILSLDKASASTSAKSSSENVLYFFKIIFY